MASSKQSSRRILQSAMAALLAVSSAAVARAQAAAPAAPAEPQIIQRVEAQAEAYQAALRKLPIEVRQTVRRYDASGHLKGMRHSSFRYSFAADGNTGGKRKRGAPDEQPNAIVLSDGVTLPLVFLPGSVAHLSLRAETPANGPWILHFQSAPCAPPKVRGHWLGANVIGQCVEGQAFLNPANGSITRIRMNMGGLPIVYRSIGYPRGMEVIDLSNDVSFRLLQRPSGAPLLIPEKSKYVTYTSHERIVVEQSFEITPPGANASHSP